MELYEQDRQLRSGEWIREWVPVPKPIPLRHVIRGALLNALAYTAGNQTRAAAALEVSVRSLAAWLVGYDIPTMGARSVARARRMTAGSTKRRTKES